MGRASHNMEETGSETLLKSRSESRDEGKCRMTLSMRGRGLMGEGGLGDPRRHTLCEFPFSPEPGQNTLNSWRARLK